MFNFLPTLPQLITYGIILLTCFPVHEFAHAWVADRFGDTTPRANGRLTLNPLAHLDPMGSLLMIVAGFGWAKPVPINPYVLQRRSRAATMLVSLAGPMSNLLMAILASVPFRLGLVSINRIYQSAGSPIPNLSTFLYLFIFVNLWLMLFNLIPIFPLDGEKVLEYFLPASGVRALENLRPYGPMLLLVIIFVLPLVGINVIGTIINPVFSFLARLLIGA
ncbi:MAG TPA: site-2 protease family protein [Anaerolineales bacterium]|nr:site-2 protease family protein [Anaerolineales bacterium]